MAETILFDVVGDIIKKLSSEAFKELGMMWGIKDDITKLTNSALIIKAVLVDAENRQYENNALSEWLGKLKHAFYDVEDVIDEFSCEALRRDVMTKDKRAKQIRIFFSQNNQLLFAHKMAHKIKNVREVLDAIAADRYNFGLTINVVEPNISHVPGRDTHSHVREEEVIGRKDDKEKVKNVLLNMNFTQNISFIVIAGMGGLGKTTLAKYLYNDEKVSKFFDLKIWVCVSELFDVEVIVKNIIESISTVRPDTCKMESLQRQFRELIEGKKYLLVLDDIWNETEEKWSDLKDLFMFGARGSKILITKRDNKPVSEIADMTLLYYLEGLSEEYSWLLFKKVAFKEGEEPNNPNLINLGKEIVQKCNGVPLLIRSIGRSLHSETSEEKWMSIKDKLRPANNVMSNLKLSYDRLPTSYLKQCFVYCSLFPKDYSITADELSRLSIALGFVPPSDSSKSMEDLGNDYFMELCWRSLLQGSILESEDDFYYDSFRITSSYQNFRFTYKMHNLMHDLAQMVAGDECKSLSNKERDGVNEKTRHISFQSALNHKSNCPTLIFKAKGLRTLLLQRAEVSHWIEMDTSTLNELFSSCVRLRVLKLNRSGIKKVPKSIKKLRQLRYLDLSRNEQLKFLPNSITELQNLQTLNLNMKDSFSSSIFFPSLKYLHLREMRNLKGWWKWEPSSLPSFPPLREITISNCPKLVSMPLHSDLISVEFEDMRLKTLKFPIASTICLTDPSSTITFSPSALEKLTLDDIKDLEYLPNQLWWHLNNLESLEISRCQNLKGYVSENEDSKKFESFSTHGKLKYLELRSLRKLVSLPIGPQNSATLQTLWISECCNLRHLPEWIGSLVSLSRLEIKKCPNLKSFPEGMCLLQSLQILVIKGCPELEERCKQGGQDWPKIAHVPILDVSSLGSQPISPTI